MKLFQNTSALTVTKDSIRATCASVLLKCHHLFPSGWHQIAFVNYGKPCNSINSSVT